MDPAALLDLLFEPAGPPFIPSPGEPDPSAGPDDGRSIYAALAGWITDQAAGSRGRPGVPFVVGVVGAVAAGKTSLAQRLAGLLGRGPGEPAVAVVSADGFLYPNAELEARGLSARKGYPETFDTETLFTTLATLKAGRSVDIPGYSHLTYDVVPGFILDPPDLVVVEGINLLQVPAGGAAVVLSDLIDVAVYLDAAEDDLKQWFASRLAGLVHQGRDDPSSFYHQWGQWSEEESARVAETAWKSINLPNLRDHIAPSRLRADVIVEQGSDHRVRRVLMRRR